MSRRLRIALWTVTGGAWSLLLASAAELPGFDGLPEPELRLAVAVAAVGTIAVLLRHLQAPADELFKAGKIIGRAEILAEIAEGNVARMPSRERPALHVVGDEA